MDISDRKRSERALKLAKEEAEAANRTKSQFLASMSHELRTPLTGILGFSELLLGPVTNEEQRRDYLQTIRSSGQHLLELINDILDLSKIEAAKLDVERSACSPQSILNDVVRIMRVQAQAKGLDLRTRWSSPIPSAITTDCARFRQILINLVGNAVKFTPKGVIDIVARIESIEETHYLFVDVTDTGIGIRAESLDTIFDPFIQAASSVTREFGGTGLGLAISGRLAKALGGNITVKSSVNVGSTFTVSIDAGDLEGVQMLPSPPADELRLGETEFTALPSVHTGDVLLVEDGQVNRKLISTVLEKTGLTVTTAENGELGVELAMKNHFDLILMDMQMPILDGYAATRRLRDLGNTTPIIALTAHAMKGAREKCLEAGCTHYATKPLAIDTLLETVADALNHGSTPDPQEFKPLQTEEQQLLVSSLPMEEDIFREIARDFVEYLNELLETMRRALVEKDMERLAELAHSLKGSAGSAGFPAFTNPSKRLERLAQTWPARVSR